jgi:hypothetical protein
MAEPAPEATVTTVDGSMDGTQADVPKPQATPPEAAPPVAPEQPAATPPAAKTYTEAEHQAGITSAVQKRLARVKQPEPPREEAPKPAPDPSPKPSTKADLGLEVDSLRSELQFERAVRGLDIDDDRRDVLETLFRAEKPEHLREWAKEKMKVMGWAKSDTSPAQSVSKTETAPTPDLKPPAGPLASDNGAPSPQPTFEQTGNPELLTKDSIARIYSEKGVRTGVIYIKDMAERWYKGRRVLVE